MGTAKKPLDGLSLRLLNQIRAHLRVRPNGVGTMSRRAWGKEMSRLIVAFAGSGASQIAVPNWLSPRLTAAVERERMVRCRKAA